MRNRASGWTSTLALSLFMAACIPAGSAWGSCNALATELLLSWQKGGENPTKPKNVSAAGAMLGTTLDISWDLPSNRPADTYTGYCVHFTHAASGETKEYCRDTSTGLTTFAAFGCIVDRNCTGTFNIKVILQNNCGLTESWSDSISYDREF